MTTEHRGALAPVSVLPRSASALARGPVLAGLIPTGPGSVADLGHFKESLAPQAFAKADMSSTQLVVGHDHSGRFTLASVRGGTLELRSTPQGLRWRAQLPDTDLSRHYASLAEAAVLGISFAFVVAKDTWTRDADGTLWRTIEAVGELADVSLVARPAYADAAAWVEGSGERGTVIPLRRPQGRVIGKRWRRTPDGGWVGRDVLEGDPPLGVARPVRLDLARKRLELAKKRLPTYAVTS
jgi:HK97 family phage prohead protease